MTDTLDPAALFLDKAKIGLFTTQQAPSANNKFVDFEFSEGDLRSMATLTYDFEQDGWYATIRVAETEDDDFDDAVDATADQLAALKAALPAEQYEKLEALKEQFAPVSSGPRV